MSSDASRSKDSADKKKKSDHSKSEFNPPELPGSPKLVPRDQHPVSRKKIDSDCLKVLRRLNGHGHAAFLVGGAVRDILNEKEPKDFDVSTDASPEQVKRLFGNSRIIGRRFRMNHVYFRGGKIIEVSTFRDSSTDSDSEEVETLARDNVFGDPESDAVRRDLTINALFYDLETFYLIDYVGGLKDLEDKVVRIIGEPTVRFQEDPIRMIRAVRHAAKNKFTIEAETEKAIISEAESLSLCPGSRLYEEFSREVLEGAAERSLTALHEYGLLCQILPELSEELQEHKMLTRFEKRLKALDKAIVASDEAPPAAFGFAALVLGICLQDEEDEVYDYFAAAPDPEEVDADEVSDELSNTARKRRKKLSKRKFRATRKKDKSPLLAAIDELFEPSGLPRKEREYMEELLTLRLLVATSSPEEALGSSKVQSKILSWAVLLQEVIDGESAAA